MPEGGSRRSFLNDALHPRTTKTMPTTATAAPMAISSNAPPGAFMIETVKSLVDCPLFLLFPLAEAANVSAMTANTTALPAAESFFPTFFLASS